MNSVFSFVLAGEKSSAGYQHAVMVNISCIRCPRDLSVVSRALVICLICAPQVRGPDMYTHALLGLTALELGVIRQITRAHDTYTHTKAL